MRLYRICRAPFTALDGEGARLYGGRWTSPGRAAVYASQTLSLAALEYLVHVDPALAPSDLVALTIEIPDDAPTESVAIDDLPRHWADHADTTELRAIGDAWIERVASLVLFVPAAPVPEELNALTNPRHPDMKRVKTVAHRDFVFDRRLV